MWKKITYILLIISIVAIGCVPFQKETPVTIQVVDKSNKPLSEITVEIVQSADTVVPSEGITIHTRRTDKNGQVSVDLPHGKKYEVTVQAEREIISVSSEPITLKVQLEKVYPEVLPGL